jgi:hypothetical protein
MDPRFTVSEIQAATTEEYCLKVGPLESTWNELQMQDRCSVRHCGDRWGFNGLMRCL